MSWLPGNPDSTAGRRVAFAEAWVSRPDFAARYDGLGNGEYVDALLANAGVAASDPLRDELVAGLDAGAITRAQALPTLASDDRPFRDTRDAGYVRLAFFAYLRRDPSDEELSRWLGFLRGGGDIRAMLTGGFLTAAEYRSRFGAP